jgi:hypothetical protein
LIDFAGKQRNPTVRGLALSQLSCPKLRFDDFDGTKMVDTLEDEMEKGGGSPPRDLTKCIVFIWRVCSPGGVKKGGAIH